MTTHRLTRTHHNTPARQVPAQFAHLHPDWLPPAGWHDPYDDDPNDIPAERANIPGETPARAELPLAFTSTALPPTIPPAPADASRNSIAQLAAPTTPSAPAADAPSASPPHAGEGPGERSNPSLAAYLAARRRQEDALALATDASLTDPTLTPDDTIAEAHDPHTFPPRSSNGRETKLSYTALPLRHRIYALHCQGRTISAIARYLRLDRGTVARHLHAIEDLLLAEQTADLARLRLRAVEAQQAILAACWDALLCEELLESDEDNDRPYPPRRAQLLATAARAARTAAHLQGLFTPAALQAALRDAMPIASDAPPATIEASGRAPTALQAAPTTPVGASGGRPPAPTTPASSTELPAGLQPAAASPTTPPAPADPAASCGMPASPPTTPAFTPADRTPAIHGQDRAAASPLPRTGEGPGMGAAPGLRRHTGAWVVAASVASRARAM